MTTQFEQVFGLVLAGGQSSRMGQDKAFLEWQGKPLFQHMHDLLKQAGISQVMVSGAQCGALDGKRDGTPGSKGGLPDKIPGKGPISGIHAAISTLSTELSGHCHLLVVPVDMPLLPVSAITALIESQSDCPAPLHFEGFTLPMLLPVTAELRNQLERAIHSTQRRDYSLWRLHQALGGQTLPLPTAFAEQFHNSNTPEDWELCRHIFSRSDSALVDKRVDESTQET